MKITIVNRHRDDTLGGSELQCDFIAKELTSRGYEVNYVAPGGRENSYKNIYTVLPCKLNSTDIVQKVEETKPDIIYWRFNKYFFYDSLKKLSGNKRKIIFAASSAYDVNWFLYKKNVPVRRNIKRFFQSTRERFGMYYVDAVVVNNESYLNKLPVSNQKFIPNGMIETSVEFNWDKPYVAWIANIKRIKRPELFIKLAGKFKGEGIDFIMVGDIQEDEYLWMNEKENLPSNLHYLGAKSLEEVNGILKNSMIHVHTCLDEGFPNVFIQAWILGIPSVSYGFDPSNYITEHELGYSANEKMEHFYEYVAHLINDHETRTRFGKNARRFAKEMFQIGNSVSKLEELFQELTEVNK